MRERSMVVLVYEHRRVAFVRSDPFSRHASGWTLDVTGALRPRESRSRSAAGTPLLAYDSRIAAGQSGRQAVRLPERIAIASPGP